MSMKSGLEIHQRLNTKKLFCECSTDMSEEPIGTIERKLRAVSGEMGLTDEAAMYEYLRDRKFVYQKFLNESCLVDEDEEPPHPIDEEALEIGLQVAKILKCDIPDEIHIMRKTVIDGSNTSGFQRTAVVGMNGEMETSFGNVSIDTISIEEESSQIISKEDDTVTYALNRLGIPLIEIGTGPDIKDPEQVKEVARRLGSMLRSTGKVKRGLGTIRQDVNVSIDGGERVEIKGVQDLELMADMVRRETERQENLLKIKKTLSQRDVEFSEPENVTSSFKNTKNKILREGIEEGKKVYGFILRGFSGQLRHPISGEKTFGKELAEYAISQGTKGMMHTDEDVSRYDLTREFTALGKHFSKKDNDVICIIVAHEDTAKRASDIVIQRAKQAVDGVPKETRMANPDGTSSFMRPLPGGDRMYPETDVPTIELNKDYLDSIPIPEPLEARRKRYIDLGVPEQAADEILKSDRMNLFERHLESDNRNKIGELITSQLKALRRDGVQVDSISDDDLSVVLDNIEDIPNESIPGIISKISEGMNPEEAITSIEVIDENEVEELVDKIVKKNRKLIEEKGDNAFKVIMGEVMRELRGRASGEIIASILKRRLESA